MDELTPKPRRETTQAADGYPRWRWTLNQFMKMADIGLFGHDDRVELISGEIVPMSPKGSAHERVRLSMTDWFQDHLPKSVRCYSEPGWKPDDENYIEPDFLRSPSVVDPQTIKGQDAYIAIEIAVTSLAVDLSVKAALYSHLRVPEYWVIDAKKLETHQHFAPGPNGYGTVQRCERHDELTSSMIPALNFRLADLKLPPTDGA